MWWKTLHAVGGGTDLNLSLNKIHSWAVNHRGELRSRMDIPTPYTGPQRILSGSSAKGWIQDEIAAASRIISAIYSSVQIEDFAKVNKLVMDSYLKNLRQMYVWGGRWGLVLSVEDNLNVVLLYLKEILLSLRTATHFLRVKCSLGLNLLVILGNEGVWFLRELAILTLFSSGRRRFWSQQIFLHTLEIHLNKCLVLMTAGMMNQEKGRRRAGSLWIISVLMQHYIEAGASPETCILLLLWPTLGLQGVTPSASLPSHPGSSGGFVGYLRGWGPRRAEQGGNEYF